ncbi:HAD-like domain-containing protein, partial [Lasiosphaeris hirsuta]
PSAASGGVPEPTPAYTLRASFLPLPAPETRPLLVVIDLNGTLLYRPSRKAPSQFVERPHARTFVSYCLDTFYVVIWSSARPDNVRKMCKQLFTPEQLDRVLAIWGRDQFGLSAEDYNRRTQCYKRLTRLWADLAIAAAHPQGLPWNQGNTVLIDDSPEKARSEPHNAITIPEFVGELNEQPEVLPLVHDYLNTLASRADVSTYIRAHPFRIDDGGLSGLNDLNDDDAAYPN